MSEDTFICNVCLQEKSTKEQALCYNEPELGGLIYVCKECDECADEVGEK